MCTKIYSFLDFASWRSEPKSCSGVTKFCDFFTLLRHEAKLKLGKEQNIGPRSILKLCKRTEEINEEKRCFSSLISSVLLLIASGLGQRYLFWIHGSTRYWSHRVRDIFQLH